MEGKGQRSSGYFWANGFSEPGDGKRGFPQEPQSWEKGEDSKKKTRHQSQTVLADSAVHPTSRWCQDHVTLDINEEDHPPLPAKN
ncbi:unnamed protein product, partial [Nesidiocoris tenuis]